MTDNKPSGDGSLCVCGHHHRYHVTNGKPSLCMAVEKGHFCECNKFHASEGGRTPVRSECGGSTDADSDNTVACASNGAGAEPAAGTSFIWVVEFEFMGKWYALNESNCKKKYEANLILKECESKDSGKYRVSKYERSQ